MSNSVWAAACRLLAHHLASHQRLDALLETLPGQPTAVERRRVRHRVYGVVRHLALLGHVVDAQIPRRPRPVLRAALLLGAFELLENPDAAPAIVHHAVGETRKLTSAGEARLVNAVLRRVPAALRTILDADPGGDPVRLALRFSHPAWMVERWIARFGAADARRLLEWDQQPAPLHARVTGAALTSWGPEKPGEVGAGALDRADRRAPGAAAAGEAPGAWPAFFRETRWPGFFLLEQPDWATVERLLAEARIYLQDPATAIAPRLLEVQSGETVLDLCAAPGGKTLLLAEAAGPGGRVVAVDLPGTRLERLKQNLARHPGLMVQTLAADAAGLTPAALTSAGLPAAFDAVLLDAPCSNTGVLRHRVDAKWRLRPSDMATLPRLQATLLAAAAALVRPGGRLIYSTCSLETEENETVVDAFLASTGGGVTLERCACSRPWESACDGAGAFLLRRK